MATPTATAPKASPKKREEARACYFNRELSWLAFNRRVLEQAQEEDYPLLERVRFLSFVASNQDEFFEVRVAGLIQQVSSNVSEVGADGLGPREQLRRIHSIAGALVEDTYRCWREQLVPALKAEGHVFKSGSELTKAEENWCSNHFDHHVFPVLTPLAVDPSHPFPQLGNKTLNILVWLDNPETPELETLMAIIPVPRILPRVVEVHGGRGSAQTYIFLSDLVKKYADRLFPGYHPREVKAFRITRNSDLYFDEEEAENLLKTIEEELFNRNRNQAVRLEIDAGTNEHHLDRLLEAIQLPREYVFAIDGPVNLMRLNSIYDLVDRPDLKFKPFLPSTPPKLREGENIFEAIAKEDFLLHHPYDSFQPVVDFLEQAATDPKVFAIKQTLYRTSSDSPIVKALIEATKNGKQVTALVELKARFDEQNNIQWARRMEEEGVHVVYGLFGLKTHCKTSLVVRGEGEDLKRYVHLGTGNYNPKTARLYTDLGMFTARDAITSEVAALFNTLTGFARTPNFERLYVAPFNLHAGMQELILREADNARAGKKARIMVKVNSLVDPQTIDHLYEASQAGVSIDLIVRGICGLVPGVPGLSENIRVRSILGRFLEHSRAFYFENADGDPVILAGSADWMPRNFFRRIETVFPIEDPRLRQRLLEEVFESSLKDNTRAKWLKANGAYALPPRKQNEPPYTKQDELIRAAERMRARLEEEQSAEAQASVSVNRVR